MMPELRLKVENRVVSRLSRWLARQSMAQAKAMIGRTPVFCHGQELVRLTLME